MKQLFTYDGTHQSDRGRILEQLPSYPQIIAQIKGFNIPKDKRALLALMLLTGARVTEVLSLRWEDIIIKDNTNEPAIMVDRTICKEALTDNVKYCRMDVVLLNLKGHKKTDRVERKTVPLHYNRMFIEPFVWVKEYLNTLGPYDSDKKLFKYSRGQVWWMVKKLFGSDYFPHLLRHVAATNDLRLGLGLESLSKKLGHRTTSMYKFYTHLNTEDLKKELHDIYGEEIEAPKLELSKKITAPIVYIQKKVIVRPIIVTKVKECNVLQVV